MTARMGHVHCFLSVLLASSIFAPAQNARPIQLGPLTVNLPQGWTVQSNASPVRIYSPDSTPASYFAVDFPAAETTTMEVRERHSQIWGNLSGLAKPGSLPQSGATGPFIWTRGEMQRSPGQTEIMALYSAKSGSSYIAVFVDATRPDLFSKNLPALEAMLSRATSSNTTSTFASSDDGNSSGVQSNATGLSTLAEYVFTTPPTWTRHKVSRRHCAHVADLSHE